MGVRKEVLKGLLLLSSLKSECNSLVCEEEVGTKVSFLDWRLNLLAIPFGGLRSRQNKHKVAITPNIIERITGRRQ